MNDKSAHAVCHLLRWESDWNQDSASGDENRSRGFTVSLVAEATT